MYKAITSFAKIFLKVAFCFSFLTTDGATIQDRISVLQSKYQLAELKSIRQDIEEICSTNLQDYSNYQEQFESALELLGATNREAKLELKTQIHLVLGRQNQKTNLELVVVFFRLKEMNVRRLVRISGSNLDLESCQVLAAFLGEIRLAIISNYERAKVYDNIMPPVQDEAGGPMNSGMNPDAIKGPKARAAYKAAIAANEKNYYQNRLQTDILPQLNDFITSLLLNSLSAKSNQGELSNGEMVRLANMANLSQLEKIRVGIQERK